MQTVHFDENLNAIAQVVCEQLQLDFEGLVSPSRKRQFTVGRQMFYAVARDKYSLSELGEFMGGRDHTTVVSAIKTHRNCMDTDTDYSAIFALIQSKIDLS